MKTKIKLRLVTLDRKQVEFIPILRERYHEKMTSVELSRIIGGMQEGNKAKRVLEEVDEILTEWEKEQNVQRE